MLLLCLSDLSLTLGNVKCHKYLYYFLQLDEIFAGWSLKLVASGVDGR